MQIRSGNGLIATSFLCALLLTVVPLPEWSNPWRPLWAAMVLIYWCMALPERIGVTAAWLLGFLLDVLEGTVFGLHSCALIFLAHVVLVSHLRLRAVPMAHQTLLVGLYLLVYGLLIWALQKMLGDVLPSWQGWRMVLSSAILWPWLFVVLRDLRRRYVEQ